MAEGATAYTDVVDYERVIAASDSGPVSSGAGSQAGGAPTSASRDARVVVRLAAPVVTAASAGRFELLQQWEGTIDGATSEEVSATIRDLSQRHMPEEIVVLPREEFSQSDAPLLEPGAVFYWSIGYRITPTGTKERVSFLRMRRVPQPTRRQAERVKERTQELLRLFGRDGGDDGRG